MSISHFFCTTDEDTETDPNSSTGISHADGLRAIETALNYMEQQEEFTVAEAIMMRRWRDSTLRKNMGVSRQKSIRDFFLNMYHVCIHIHI